MANDVTNSNGRVTVDEVIRKHSINSPFHSKNVILLL